MLKKSLASFALTILGASLLLPTLTRTAEATPPEGTDDYVDTFVMENTGLVYLVDLTAEATDSDFDMFWDEIETWHYYIGYDKPFDSFTVEVKEAGSISGSYDFEYWNGSSWQDLSSSVSQDSDSYKVSWDAPSDWAETSITDGRTTTRTLYFVKYTLLDDRGIDKEASQIGVNLSSEEEEETPSPTPDDDDDSSSSSSGSDDPNLKVTDLQVEDDEDLVVEMENNGDDDAGRDVQYTIYVDGDKELEDEFDENYFEEGDSLTWTFRGFFDQEDDDEDYKVEVCLDEDDDIDEESESDNCRTETFTIDGTGDNDDDDDDDDSDSDQPDLYVDDILLNNDDEVEFTLGNKGDEDVSDSDDVTVKVYVDGDKVWSKTYDQDSDDSFLDEDEKDTINAGELLEDEDETYEVEVCVDTSDNVDEEKESNNCETEDLRIDDNNDDDVELSSDCDAFYDIDGHWAEDYICNLYERGVVEGRLEDRYYFPDSYVTRAEFAKMVLLSAEENVEEDSRYDDYSDVSSSKWYYPYITFGTQIGILTGYEGTPYFKPDNYVDRAEAVAMLMRMEEDVDGRVDSSDIPFWDVDRYDWFAGAVVAAADYDFIDGYGDGSFRPGNYITRGEAAKIVDLAYDEFYR